MLIIKLLKYITLALGGPRFTPEACQYYQKLLYFYQI